MSSIQTPEDEVWGREVQYWEYVKTGDLTAYAALWHDSVIGWPSNQPRPVNKDGVLTGMKSALAVLQPGTASAELTRLSVHVVDNVGIAYLEVNVSAVTKANTPFQFKERFIHTWLRDEQGWRIIGGMSAPPVGPQSA